MEKYKSFETERLILRPTSAEDSEFLVELLNTPKWLKYIGDRNVRSVEDAQAYIKNRIQSQFERLGYGSYTVIRKEDNLKLGACGLYDRDGLEGVDLGFAFLPHHERQGYAFEAANRIKQASLEEFGLSELKAITTKDNTASHQLLEKLGFEFEKAVQLPSDFKELLLYKLIVSG